MSHHFQTVVRSLVVLTIVSGFGLHSAAQAQAASVVYPLNNFTTRITKKPFAKYITPKTSPIQPEKFQGYHTGADAETTAKEKNATIPVYSIAAGKVLFVGYVNGYGGVIIIRHTIGKETVTALYGHIRLASTDVKKNSTVKAGQKISILGKGFSSETSGERKHLHFGLLKGTNYSYRGYVTYKSSLGSWLDPVAWLKAHKAVAP
ncbi:MAG: M23 family metallopeptidase [Patescibacteria group bacterium]